MKEMRTKEVVFSNLNSNNLMKEVAKDILLCNRNIRPGIKDVECF
jgi:hypothetical protein